MSEPRPAFWRAIAFYSDTLEALKNYRIPLEAYTNPQKAWEFLREVILDEFLQGTYQDYSPSEIAFYLGRDPFSELPSEGSPSFP